VTGLRQPTGRCLMKHFARLDVSLQKAAIGIVDEDGILVR
jgi:hypothetical protein